MNVLDRLDTTLRVVGGARLDGSVEMQGSKNSALPIMAAALLAAKVTLHRVPRITDVSVMWSLLEALGARSRSKAAARSRSMREREHLPRAVRIVRKLAASFDLAVRCSAASDEPKCRSRAAACSGTRATDMHEAAFRALGATSRSRTVTCRERQGRRLRGGEVDSACPSVGATKNAMLAAVAADGTTTLRNAAMEPEVVDLANFLVAMGAKISGHGGDTCDRRRRELHGVEY